MNHEYKWTKRTESMWFRSHIFISLRIYTWAWCLPSFVFLCVRPLHFSIKYSCFFFLHSLFRHFAVFIENKTKHWANRSFECSWLMWKTIGFFVVKSEMTPQVYLLLGCECHPNWSISLYPILPHSDLQVHLLWWLIPIGVAGTKRQIDFSFCRSELQFFFFTSVGISSFFMLFTLILTLPNLGE